MKIGIIDLCKQIEDPRMNRKKVHKMETIIYISIAAVICGAQSWNCLLYTSGAAWLSSARAVRCRLKCHNERNPYL